MIRSKKNALPNLKMMMVASNLKWWQQAFVMLLQHMGTKIEVCVVPRCMKTHIN